MAAQARIDGESVNRALDLPFIHQPQNQSHPKLVEHLGQPDQSPALGILTHTVVRSPVVKWILPARIRHEDKDDVVFVREDSIQIKEFVDCRYLEDIVVKTDFASTILSARVIGPRRDEPREAGLIDFGSSQRIPPQILVMVTESNVGRYLIFLFAFHDVDSHVKFLSHRKALPNYASHERRLGVHLAIDPRFRAMAVAGQQQSLVIYTLKSRKDMCQEVEVESGLKEECFKPIREERELEIEGTIISMEFLYTPSKEDQVVQLLLVVARKDKVELIRYEWDCTRNLRNVKPASTGVPVAQSLGEPLYVVPITLMTGFILVCERAMVTYPNVLTTWETKPIENLYSENDDYQTADDPGASADRPRWTYWTRPFRREKWFEKNDSIYLCRSDGVVRSIRLEKYKEGLDFSVHSHLGYLHLNVDTAFAALDSRDQIYDDKKKDGSIDILITPGTQSEGAVLLFRIHEPGAPQQFFPNWGYVVDFAVVPSNVPSVRSLNKPNNGRQPYGRDRVFACAGSGLRHGSLCEMRIGVLAQTIVRSRMEGTGCSRLWLLPDYASDGVCMLISGNGQSQAYHLPNPGWATDITISGIEASNSVLAVIIQTEADTLTAAETIDRTVVLVTSKSIWACRRAQQESEETQLFCRTLNDLRKDLRKDLLEDGITKAFIDSGTSLLLFTVRYRSEGTLCSVLCCGQFTRSDQDEIKLEMSDDHELLRDEPTCLYLQTVGDIQIAFVGLRDQMLLIYRVTRLPAKLTCEHAYQHVFKEEYAVCESVLVMRCEPNVNALEKYILLCGLRNGTLQIFKMTVTKGSGIVLQHQESVSVGTTAVSIISEHIPNLNPGVASTRAVINCGESFCRLTYRMDTNDELATINCIWLTDHKKAGLYQAGMQAVAQLQCWFDNQSSSIWARNLICIDDSYVYVVRLDHSIDYQAVPRRVRLGATPTRVIYSRILDRLLVGGSIVQTIDSFNAHGGLKAGDRYSFPFLKLVAPSCRVYTDKSESDMVMDSLQTIADPSDFNGMVFGQSGERITGLVEWQISQDNKSLPMIVVSIIRVEEERRGQIRIFKLIKNEEDEEEEEYTIADNRRLGFSEAQPVDCLIPLNNNNESPSLLYCTGTKLVLVSLIRDENNRGRFDKLPIYCELPSRGQSISVEGNLIYLSTAIHSIQVFKIDLDTKTIIHFAGDYESHPGQHNVLLPEKGLVLAANRDNSIRGFVQPSETRAPGRSLTHIFEAILPKHITKLALASIKPAWKETQDADSTVLGSTMDGAYYQFDVLEKPKWRLLHFIQKLAERNRTICPYTWNEAYGDVKAGSEIDKVEGLLSKQDMHVDGDILLRLLQSRFPPAAVLLERDMVRRERQERCFVELAMEALEELKGGRINKDDEDESVRVAAVAVVQYLRKLLQAMT